MDKSLLALGEVNPAFFARYFLGLKLNTFNVRFLFALAKYKQNLTVCSNQVGKTVSLAIAHIWYNFYKRGFVGDPEVLEKSRYETLNISPVSRQSSQAFQYVEEILHSNFTWELNGKRYINNCKIEWFWEGKNENLGRVDFSNNTSFYCLSTGQDKGSGLSGAQFALITYDEAPQSHHLQEELGARIFSRTAKYDGDICLVGTPDDLAKSQQYWYHLHREAKKKEGEWHLVEGVYDENIFIPEAKRENFKRRLKATDPIRYAQVILGSFIASALNMFGPRSVHSLWNGKQPLTAPPIIDDNNIEREYLISIDWGVADEGDETVMLVGDITDYYNPEIVFAWAKQGGDPVELLAMAQYLQLQYNDGKMILDTTEMGGTIFKKMLSNCKPISFGQGNKPDALVYIKIRLRNNLRKEKDLTTADDSAKTKLRSIYLPKLETQLGTYKLDDKKLKQDWVMSLAQLCWYLEKYKKQKQAKSFPLKLYPNAHT